MVDNGYIIMVNIQMVILYSKTMEWTMPEYYIFYKGLVDFIPWLIVDQNDE